MNTNTILENIWVDTCNNLGLRPNTSIFKYIIGVYSQKDRYYHDIEHLSHCIITASSMYEKFDHPDEAIMALFFHDLIYDTHNDDIENVMDSADACEEYLKAMSIQEPDHDTIELIKTFIYATDHTMPPVSPDHAMVMDIDLMMIIMLDPHVAEIGIRNEYHWVPIDIYSRARKDILIKLFLRDRILNSNYITTQMKLYPEAGQPGGGVPVETAMRMHLMEMIKINGVNVGVGGTFDLFHEGHRNLIEEAFEVTGHNPKSRVMIGLTSDAMASKKSHPVQPYSVRAKQISDFIMSHKHYRSRWSIQPLDDPVGDLGTNPDYDILVASRETEIGARRVNDVRRSNGLNPVILHFIEVVTDENGERISSTRLRNYGAR